MFSSSVCTRRGVSLLVATTTRRRRHNHKVLMQQQQRSLSTLLCSNYSHYHYHHHHHHHGDWIHSFIGGGNKAILSSSDLTVINRNLVAFYSSNNNDNDDENDNNNNYNNDNVNDDFPRPHKHYRPIIRAPPPSPQPSRFITVVEPPVRSRPFRPFSRRNKLHQKQNFKSGGKKKTVITPNNNTYHHHDDDDDLSSDSLNTTTQTIIYASYPVQAVQIAQQIDLAATISKVFATKGLRKMIERLSVVIQLPPETTETTGDVVDKEGLRSRRNSNLNQQQRFIAVFQFGSVVFFNVAPRDVTNYIKLLKLVSIDPVLMGNEIKETFCVHVQPEIYKRAIMKMKNDAGSDSGGEYYQKRSINDNNIEDIQVVSGDYCIVQELNMKSVDVISNIMAQSVALDSYNDTVDELLANFEKINAKVVKGGGTSESLSTMDRDQMFRAVARNNSIFIEMVSRVGIKDRIDTAWNLSQYEDIHDGLKEEFDIDQRFEHIEFKLNLIQQNAKFFLEVLAHQKSNSLEWMIIVLIMFECVLMVMEMSGVGEVVFGALGDKILK